MSRPPTSPEDRLIRNLLIVAGLCLAASVALFAFWYPARTELVLSQSQAAVAAPAVAAAGALLNPTPAAPPPADRAAAAVSTPLPTPAIALFPTPTPAAAVASLPESEYLDVLTRHLADYADANLEINARLTELAANAALLEDPAWTTAFSQWAGNIKATNQAIRDLPPPARYADAHADLVAMTAELDSAMDHYLRGLETLDANEFLLGGQDYVEGIELLTQAQAKIEAAR